MPRKSKCTIGGRVEVPLLREGRTVDNWACEDPLLGAEVSVDRVIYNPKTGSAWASRDLSHDKIAEEFVDDVSKEMGRRPWYAVPVDMLQLEKVHGWNQWSIYNQEEDGQKRNARILQGVRKLHEEKEVGEDLIVCVGTYLEHSINQQACARVGDVLKNAFLKRCKRTSIEECPSDTDALRKALSPRSWKGGIR